MFQFGGSIMATVFPAGSIMFDRDLLEHSARSCETRVNLGSGLGRATKGAAAGPPAGAAQ